MTRQLNISQLHQHQNMTAHRIMRIIATTAEPHDCIKPALVVGNETLRARGCAFCLLKDPDLIVTCGELEEEHLPDLVAIEALMQHLDADISILDELPEEKNQFPAWLVSAIQIGEDVVGALIVAFDTVPEVTDEMKIDLAALIDGLTVIAVNVRSAARHEKLGRNQSEFMRIVSHDLRSPLTSIQGFASMLESGMVGEMNEKQTYFVDKILSGIAQMTSLVDNIQDAGRYDPETGFYEMERSQCDLGEMIQKIMRNHLLPAEKQDLTLEAAIADDVPIINADVNMLERAITNLVDNAIKYTPNGGGVSVNVYCEDDDLIISVADNGLGISPDHQKLLFERHVRIPRREHKRIKGSGLGLFIVRSVARRHGGDAWVTSEEGQGSTFYIGIPLNDANTMLSRSEHHQ